MIFLITNFFSILTSSSWSSVISPIHEGVDVFEGARITGIALLEI